MRVGLAAIFKNEYPYILEWIAYHRKLGVDKFYIADNVSDDGSSELLQALDDIGLITRISFPRVGEHGPQAPAYNHIIKHFGDEIDILGFIDADEFVVPENNIKDSLKEFHENDSYGAIGVNWKIYGSSNDYFSSGGLVIQRFTKHSKLDYDNNRHIKTFLKPNYVTRMNIHECELSKGEYCNSLNELAEFDESRARTLVTHHENIYINHYVVKSRVEHFIIKRKKGSAAGLASREKGIGYFLSHDINSEVTKFSQDTILDVRSEIKHLKRLLLKESSFMRLGRGHADVNTSTNLISGWVVAERKVPNFVLIRIGDDEYKVPVNKDRKDVFKKGLSTHLKCGFLFKSIKPLLNKEVNVLIYGSIQDVRVKYL